VRTLRPQDADGIVLGFASYNLPTGPGGGAVDHRSRHLPLGLVLYEMRAVAPPFGATTCTESRYRLQRPGAAAERGEIRGRGSLDLIVAKGARE